jgi:hypothetical protein
LRLEQHHAAARDALHAFADASAARLGNGQERITDLPGLATALANLGSDFMTSMLPVLGIPIGQSLTSILRAAGGEMAGWDASSGGAERALRRLATASDQGLTAGFKEASLALPELVSGLASSDPAVRSALEAGSQDQVDAVITAKLGIPDPNRPNAYGDLRRALEEELAQWLEAEPPVEMSEPGAAAGPPDSVDDEWARTGKKAKPKAPSSQVH